MKYIVLLFCLFLFSCQETYDARQILEKVRDNYDDLQAVSLNVEVIFGNPNPESDDMIGHVRGVFKAKKQGRDNLLGWKLASDFPEKDNPENAYLMRSSGDSLFWMQLTDSLVEKLTVDNVRSDWGYIYLGEMRELVSRYCDRLEFPDTIFNKRDYTWEIGTIILLQDTMIEGRKCFLIQNTKQGDAPRLQVKTHQVEKLAIDQENYLPLFRYKRFKRFVKGDLEIDQKTYYLFSEVQVNPHLPDSVFEFKGEHPAHVATTLEPLDLGDKAPDWCLESVTGDTVSLYGQTGEVFLLDFGYWGCGNCVLANKELKQVYSRYSSSRKVNCYYINPFDSMEKLKRQVKQENIPYPALKGNKQVVIQYGLQFYPLIIILDRNKIVRSLYSGYYKGMADDINQSVDDVLNGSLE